MQGLLNLFLDFPTFGRVFVLFLCVCVDSQHDGMGWEAGAAGGVFSTSLVGLLVPWRRLASPRVSCVGLERRPGKFGQ
jgi:hypothetical protein